MTVGSRELIFNCGILKHICEGRAYELSTIIRPEDLDLVLSKVLSFSMYDLPGFKSLILGSKELYINEVDVVIKEDDEIKFPVWSSNRKGTTHTRVDQVKHALSGWHRGGEMKPAGMLCHDT